MRSARVPVVAGNLGGGRKIDTSALTVIPDTSADMLLGFVTKRLPVGNQRSRGLDTLVCYRPSPAGANRNIGSAGR